MVVRTCESRKYYRFALNLRDTGPDLTIPEGTNLDDLRTIIRSALSELERAALEQQLLGWWRCQDMTTHAARTNGLMFLLVLPEKKVEWIMRLTGYGIRTRTGTYSLEASGNLIWPQTKSQVMRIQPRKDTPRTTSAALQEDGTPILLFNLLVGSDTDNRVPTGVSVLKFQHALSEYVLTQEYSPTTHQDAALQGGRESRGEIKIMVQGITTPGVYHFRKDEPCTIMYLIFKMGGLARFSKGRVITIHRLNPAGSESEIKVDIGDLMETGDPKKDVPLKNGDRVNFGEQRVFSF